MLNNRHILHYLEMSQHNTTQQNTATVLDLHTSAKLEKIKTDIYPARAGWRRRLGSAASVAAPVRTSLFDWPPGLERARRQPTTARHGGGASTGKMWLFFLSKGLPRPVSSFPVGRVYYGDLPTPTRGSRAR